MNHASEWIVGGLLRATVSLSIAALLVGLAVRGLRVRSPRAEQFAWLLVLAQGLLLAPFSLPVPAHWLSAVPVRPTEVSTSQITIELPGVPAAAENVAVEDRERVALAAVGAEPAKPTAMMTGAPINGKSQTFLPAWAAIAVVIWLAGIVTCAGIGLLRYRVFTRRLQATQAVLPEWQAEWQVILDEQRVVAAITLVATADAGPALCRTPAGYRLVVPAMLWSKLVPAQRELILRHELAHFQRGDLWTALAAQGLAAVHWFNPLAWWAMARVEAQSEFACDRAAAGDDPVTFAAALLRLGAACGPGLAGVQSARSGSLFERVQRLLSEPPHTPRWKGACLVFLAALGLAPTAVRLHAMAPPPAPNQPADAIQAVSSPEPERRGVALVGFGTDDLRTRDFITDVAFSPDGKLIAAADANAPVPTPWLFDVHKGTREKRLVPTEKASGSIQCLAFSPDQSKLAWGETGGYVALWDLTVDRLVWREKLHQGFVNDVAFSSNGSLMASGADDGAVHVTQMADPVRGQQKFATGGAPRAVAGGMSMTIRSSGGSLAFTPDEARLVVGSAATNEISIWRIQDGKLLRRIEKSHGSLNSIAVTPDGRQIISSGQHMIPITETKLKYGPKNVTLTEIRVWDIETGRRQKDLNGNEDYGSGQAALSRDGKRVAVGDFGSLRILDTETGRIEQTISLPGFKGNRPEFSPDGNLVAMPINNVIGLFEVATGRRLHHDEQTPVGELVSAAWSPSGERLVTGHTDGGVRLWEAATGKLVWHKLLAPVLSPYGASARPAFVAFSADGHRIVAGGQRDDPVEWRSGIVTVYETKKGLLVRSVDQQRVWHGALSSDRKTVVVGTSNGGAHDTRLHGVEVETSRILYTTPPEDVVSAFFQMRAMQFRPASSTLMLADGNGDVIELDGHTGKEQRRFVAEFRSPEERQAGRFPDPQIWKGAFSADARILVTSSAEFVYVWDVENGKMTRKIRHPHDHGCVVSVSPDGKTVATSDLQYGGDYGEDTIRLFDLESGKQIMKMELRDNRAVVLVFSPDGTKLFTGFYRGSATVWDVRR